MCCMLLVSKFQSFADWLYIHIFVTLFIVCSIGVASKKILEDVANLTALYLLQ